MLTKLQLSQSIISSNKTKSNHSDYFLLLLFSHRQDTWRQKDSFTYNASWLSPPFFSITFSLPSPFLHRHFFLLLFFFAKVSRFLYIHLEKRKRGLLEISGFSIIVLSYSPNWKLLSLLEQAHTYTEPWSKRDGIYVTLDSIWLTFERSR